MRPGMRRKILVVGITKSPCDATNESMISILSDISYFLLSGHHCYNVRSRRSRTVVAHREPRLQSTSHVHTDDLIGRSPANFVHSMGSCQGPSSAVAMELS